MLQQFGRSVSMSTSGSSVASETPDSEHTVSVLDFSQRCAASFHQQVCAHCCCLVLVNSCPAPASSAVLKSSRCLQSAPSSCKRKRSQEVNFSEEHQQPACFQSGCEPTHSKTSKQSRTHLQSGAQSPAVSSAESATYYKAVYNCLVQWCYRLKALQPKCVITKDVLYRALDLFHRFRLELALQSTDQTQPNVARTAVTAAHLAGCLWLAAKNDGNRALVPSRTLLTRAVAVQPDDLNQAELTVCCKLNWNIFNREVASVCLHGATSFNRAPVV